jgi:hypothetical protein
MTVPLLFGWEAILTVVALLVALAVAFFVVSAAGTARGGRSEWQASLDARSRRPRGPATDGDERSADTGPPDTGIRPGRTDRGS